MIATMTQVDSRAPSNSSGPQILQRPLPPSERDFEVFELVVIEGASTRAAAARLGVSQTRIVQIRDRVAEWIGTSVPPVQRLTARQRLVLAANIAEERIRFLLSEVMEAWRNSRGEQTTVRYNSRGEQTQVTRQTHGDTRYLSMAMRINDHTLRLAGCVEQVLAKAETSASVEDHREADAFRSPEAAPPVRDCSTEADADEIAAIERDEADVGNSDAPEVCDETEGRRRAFFAPIDDAMRPVQPADVDADEPSVLALAAGAESLSSGVADEARRPLSRKERRARQRMLEKLRRKQARRARA